MGRKKKITVIEDAGEEHPVDLSPVELAREAEKEEKELQEKIQSDVWLSEFRGRFTDQPAKILVERFDAEGEWAVCRKYPLSSFDPDTLRLEYGGGKYRCTLFDPQGKWVKDGRTYFKFADSIVPVVPQRAENILENPMVSMMIAAQKNTADMLMGVLKSILTVQQTGGGAIGAPRASSLSEVVEVVKSLNTMAPKDKVMDTFKETLGMMKLVKEVTGDSGDADKGGLLSDLKEVIEVLPLLKEHMATLKVPTTPGAPVQIQTAKGNEMDPLTKKIIDLVPKFVGGARANASVSEWGAFLLDAFDVEVLPLLLPVMKEKYRVLVQDEDDCYDIILRLAKDPTERSLALKQIAPFAAYMPWVNQVIDEAIRLAEMTEPEIVTGGNAVLDAVGANGTKTKDDAK